jgi:uncharacterized protein (UPF0248 family)
MDVIEIYLLEGLYSEKKQLNYYLKRTSTPHHKVINVTATTKTTILKKQHSMDSHRFYY